MNYQNMTSMEAMQCLLEKRFDQERIVETESGGQFRIQNWLFEVSYDGGKRWEIAHCNCLLFSNNITTFRLISGPGSEEEKKCSRCYCHACGNFWDNTTNVGHICTKPEPEFSEEVEQLLKEAYRNLSKVEREIGITLHKNIWRALKKSQYFTRK